MEIAYARSPYIAKNFLLTSPITVGKIHDGIFYGPGNEEVIIYNEDYFNPYAIAKDWRNIRAVEVIQHNCSDLSLLIPNGKDHYTDQGLSFISVNIPLLLLQYRGFLLEQSLPHNTANYNAGLNTAHFVNMFVLPNMLFSHVEKVIFNRIFNLTIGAPMGKGTSKYPFLVLDYSERMDNILNELIDRMKDKSFLYSSVLQHIPGMFTKDMQVALEVPDFGRTRQVWWACLTSRIRQMYFLMYLGGKNGINMNRSLYNRACIDLERLLKDPSFRNTLYPDTQYEYKWMIEEILKNN